MPTSYRVVLLRHLQAELDRLKDPALNERAQAIIDGFDQAIAAGVEPSPWLDHAAQKLQDELAATIAQRARLVAELDRWDEPTGKN